MRSGFSVAILLACVLSVASHADSADEWVARADSLRLHEDRGWLRLLHYRKKGRGFGSDVDGGYFFLSSRGKIDPRAEMGATLRALLSREDLSPALDSGMEIAKMHPACKFRARRMFFEERLGVPDSAFPDADCGRYERWRAALRAPSATLVFASSYLNNPASMFGHVFLRLNTRAESGSGTLLNYAIVYGAAVPPGDNVSFLYKGLFGFYPGYYSLAPYYLSIQKYTNLESRDLWEYPLALSPEAMERLLAHVWELGASWMDYYFFTENCAYNILTLLEAADPDLELSDFGFMPVIPAEAVRRARAVPGLVEAPEWRPSILNRFRIRRAELGKEEEKFLEDLLERPDSAAMRDRLPFSPDTVAGIVDIGLDWVQYRKRRAGGADSLRWGDQQEKILALRVVLPSAPDVFPVGRLERFAPPESGHAPRRVSLSAGGDAQGAYARAGFRLLYHDLNGRETGYLPGSQLEALSIETRAGAGPDFRGPPRFALEKLEILNILSLAPTDRIERHLSWGLRAGYEARPSGAAGAGRAVSAAGGAGIAFHRDGNLSLLPFFLAQVMARVPVGQGGGASFGPQALAGLRASIGESHSFLLGYRGYNPLPPGDPFEHDVSFEYRSSVSANVELRVGAEYLAAAAGGRIAWLRYF